MVTVKDVAEKSGVSISTVSHVINGTRFVSDELKAKVREVMEELDYQPNLIARSLRGKRTNSLGLITSDITNPFFSQIAWNIEHLGYLNDYSVMLCNSDGDPAKEEFYLDRLFEWRVDGIILVSSALLPDRLNTFYKPEYPIILVDMDCDGYLMDNISVDNYQGGQIAAQHLIELGHKRIVCISGSRETQNTRGRVEGFRSAMQEAGVHLDDGSVAWANFKVDSGKDVAMQLFNRPQPPTAIFACGDLIAIGAMQAAYLMGLKIPDDVSIMGFDDIYLSQYTIPPLTTIRQPISELANEAVKCIMEKIDDPEKISRSIRLKLNLIDRGSTQPVREKSQESQITKEVV